MTQMLFGYRRASLLAAESGVALDDGDAALIDVLFPRASAFIWPADRL